MLNKQIVLEHFEHWLALLIALSDVICQQAPHVKCLIEAHAGPDVSSTVSSPTSTTTESTRHERSSR